MACCTYAFDRVDLLGCLDGHFKLQRVQIRTCTRLVAKTEELLLEVRVALTDIALITAESVDGSIAGPSRLDRAESLVIELHWVGPVVLGRLSVGVRRHGW